MPVWSPQPSLLAHVFSALVSSCSFCDRLFPTRWVKANMISAPGARGISQEGASSQHDRLWQGCVEGGQGGNQPRCLSHSILTSAVHARVCFSVWHLSEVITSYWKGCFLVLCLLSPQSPFLPNVPFSYLYNWILCSSPGVTQFDGLWFRLVVVYLVHAI